MGESIDRQTEGERKRVRKREREREQGIVDDEKKKMK